MSAAPVVPCGEELSVSESRIDRVLASWTVDGSGPLTRSLTEFSTSGVIEQDALRCSIESHLPIQIPDLREYLRNRNELSTDQADQFRGFCQSVESVLDARTGANHTQFSQLYGPVDPDFDGRIPKGLPQRREDQGVEPLMTLCDGILTSASYRRLTQEEIEQCVGVASQFGVQLHVNFELFEQLAVYARGDVMGTRVRRRLSRLYQPEQVEIPVYQRMVVLFRLNEDVQSEEDLKSNAVHLRMFKNIPKQDVDMLLPGARVRLSKIDRAKIIVPSLGGFVLAIRKIVQFLLILAALTIYKTAVLLGLVLVAIGYVVRSVLSYFHTKDRHLLNLTRNLYFQKLDTNAGVGYRMIQQANRQIGAECILALHAIMSSEQAISTRKLRRRCERIAREAVGIEIDFQVDRALEMLRQCKLVQADSEGRWEIRGQTAEAK